MVELGTDGLDVTKRYRFFDSCFRSRFHQMTTPLNACSTTNRLQADIAIRDGTPKMSPVWICLVMR